MRNMFVAMLLVALLALTACVDREPTSDFGPLGHHTTSLTTSQALRLIVTAQPGTSLASLQSAVAAERGLTHRRLGIIHALAVSLPNKTATKRLAKHPAVYRMEADAVADATARPDKCSPWPECRDGGDDTTDPPADPQITPWGISRIGADQTWSVTKGAGVNVVVIDTGIDPDHPDLNVIGGINFTSAKGGKPSAWKDDNGHGTHVAGTIAALDNEQGVVGVAPEVNLYACKALDRRGSGYVSDIIACIDWAAANDMHVANLSLGAQTHVQALQDACDSASLGTVLVVASGNDGDTDPPGTAVDYPAKYDSTITVGATDDTDAIAYFSSYGPEVNLAAPGVDILSTYQSDDLAIGSGTSMATPHVAGAVALMLAHNPGLTGACIQDLLEAHAVDLGPTGRDDWFGSGLVDLPAALAAATDGCVP